MKAHANRSAPRVCAPSATLTPTEPKLAVVSASRARSRSSALTRQRRRRIPREARPHADGGSDRIRASRFQLSDRPGGAQAERVKRHLRQVITGPGAAGSVQGKPCHWLPAVTAGTRSSGFSGDQGTTLRCANGAVPKVRRCSSTDARAVGLALPRWDLLGSGRRVRA
jgi:hypothetical protein